MLLVMVNIAFPYKESDASAMNTALEVLQTMAERGNKYISACHSLLTKVKMTMRPRHALEASGHHPESSSSREPRQNDTLSQSSTVRPALPLDQPQSFNLDLEGDPALWAEVLDSIGIDMDRQWATMALRREQQLENTETHNEM